MTATEQKTTDAPHQVKMREWELEAARQQYYAHRLTQKHATKSSEDYAAWAVSAASVAMNISELFLDEITRLQSQLQVMREALEDIEASHLPDQPAESPLSERAWAMQWIGRLRGIAKVALEPPHPAATALAEPSSSGVLTAQEGGG